MKILNTKYEKADIAKIVSTHCTYLGNLEQDNLVKLLLEFKDLFDDTLRNWQTEPMSFDLKGGVKPYHGWAYPI